jgi:transposase-like protein
MYSTMTVRQFRRRFRTEKDCLNYLSKRKWPDGFRCPRCGHDQAYLITTRRVYQCKACKHHTSLTANTIFHKTRKPLRDWFWAIFVVATRTTGSSARQIQHDLGIAYQTAWTWCHKIRTAMREHDTPYVLQDLVELDDTYVGGKKKPGKRGRGAAAKVPVMVAVESHPKGCGHVAMKLASPLSSLNAQSFAYTKIKPETAITTDGFPVYSSLAKHFTLYQIIVNDGVTAVKSLPRVHRVIERLKSWLRGTHCHVSEKHLDNYLAEFSYRFNRRFKHRRNTIFDRLVTACCNSKGVIYIELVADQTG